MKRGEVWLAEVGRKRRPVVVLTRNEVLEYRALVTIAEVTSTMRGLAAEVPIDHVAAGVDQESVVNCDGLHTVPQTLLTKQVGAISNKDLQRVCDAIAYALGC
ncbi:MAG: type II toxin-antitoxin system PemK/MazF family toxin [Acidimicrobiia bacterium]|nr:type II toxin-antitoxin system PemK/MazF family toxin [Acidimicrobiia bacterium]